MTVRFLALFTCGLSFLPLFSDAQTLQSARTIWASDIADVPALARDVDLMLRSGELELGSIQRDGVFPGRTHERLNQYHLGVRVFGGQLVWQKEAGRVLSITGKLFGRSAVEILMGEIFEPERLLKSHTGRPRWGRYGWEPSSASFRDSFTHDWVNVLIDHVLVSQQIPAHGAAPHKVWNPWQLDEAEPIKKALLAASDHFPVTFDLA